MCRYQTNISVYIPHIISLQSTMLPQKTDIHTFTLLANKPVTLSMYVPLQWYCGLSIDFTLLYIQVTKNSCTLSHQVITTDVPARNVYLKCKYANYYMCIYAMVMLVYITYQLNAM